MRYVGDGERGTTCPERPTGPSGRTLSAGVGAGRRRGNLSIRPRRSLCIPLHGCGSDRHLVTGQTATRCLSSS